MLEQTFLPVLGGLVSSDGGRGEAQGNRDRVSGKSGGTFYGRTERTNVNSRPARTTVQHPFSAGRAGIASEGSKHLSRELAGCRALQTFKDSPINFTV